MRSAGLLSNAIDRQDGFENFLSHCFQTRKGSRIHNYMLQRTNLMKLTHSMRPLKETSTT